MAERKESSFTGRELAGVALFTLSIFPVVLVALALAKGGVGEAGGTASLARGLVESVGYLPSLFCGVGFAAVGATLLLSSRELEIGRHLSGALFGAIGLAVIMGAFHESPSGLLHGGEFGAATGGALRSAIGAWSGALVGGAILFLSIWLAWLGGSIALPATKKSGSAATLSDALTEKDTDGVTAAEATALVPDASTLAYMEELWRRTAASSTQAVPVPPSPYPDDVRLQGNVPDGALPLPTSDEATATSGEADTPAAGGDAATAQPAAELGTGTDLAGARDEPLAGASGAARAGADPFGSEAQELTLSPEAARALAGSPSDPAPPAHPKIPEGAQPLVVETPGAQHGGPPVPTWEASPEADASSLSLVRHAPGRGEEEVRSGGSVSEAEIDEPEVDEYEEEEAEHEEGEEAEYEEVEEAELEEGEYEEDELEEGEEAELEEDEEAELEEDEEAELEEDEEAELEEDEEAELEEDEEAELEEDEEAELEEDEEAELEEDEEAELEEDEEAELEEDEEAELEEDEEAELEEGEEAELEEDEEAELEEDEEAELEEDEEAELEEDEEAELEEDEGDELEEDEEAELEEEAEAAAQLGDVEAEADSEEPGEAGESEPSSKATAEPEPQVVLQPQPAPEGAPDRVRLVFDAGMLFLEQGRVAVSLLQRRFGLEFDEACEVLDELQDVGLIGPYRGGQKRDILLSPEEWETRAEAL